MTTRGVSPAITAETANAATEAAISARRTGEVSGGGVRVAAGRGVLVADDLFPVLEGAEDGGVLELATLTVGGGAGLVVSGVAVTLIHSINPVRGTAMAPRVIQKRC